MRFHVLTLFPQMIEQGLSESITGRALKQNIISLNTVNIRDFAHNKHNKVDDYTYGGGAGMLMQAEPVYQAVRSVVSQINKCNQVHSLSLIHISEPTRPERISYAVFCLKKRASGFLRKPSRRSQRDSVSVAIKPLFSMVSGCVRIENHRKYTEKYTGSCALFEKRRHAMNVHRIFTFHSV